MCGISGFIDLKSGRSSQEILRKMTDSLIHRGPDGEGTEFLEEDDFVVGLGHRRLAIIELSDLGKQPMFFDGCYITFNGEIYNFREIKSELEKLGHHFKSDSDTEVILHSYREWGTDCLQRFTGMFAFLIYDKKNKEIFCARDRAGVKPFYFFLADSCFLFASELKSFYPHPAFSKKIDPDSVSSYLRYGNIPAPHCIFENCAKLRPGHYLKFRVDKLPKDIKEVETTEYWSVYSAYQLPKMDLSFPEAKEKTRKVLQTAFDYRMVSDVPVGVFLSGGYDSACVTALLQNKRSERLKTFTIGVPDIGLNEAPYAKEVAAHLGTDHHEFQCTHQEAINLIPNLPFFYDEPFADSSAIPTMLVSLMARKEVTVALSADGGDEVFAGYNRYDYMLRYGQKVNKIPGFGRKILAGIMDNVAADKIPYLKNKYNFAQRYEKVKGVLRNPSKENIMLSLSELFTENQLDRLLKTESKKQDSAYDCQILKNASPLSYMMAMDYTTYLPDDILTKVDRASMHCSLESREPFLDHSVIEWSAQLPDNFKYRDGQKKYILKEIVHDFIPPQLLDRPKMGFAIPIEKWLADDLRSLVEEYLSQSRIERGGIFEWKEIESLKREFFAGKKEFGVKIWYLLMFEMWMERNLG